MSARAAAREKFPRGGGGGLCLGAAPGAGRAAHVQCPRPSSENGHRQLLVAVAGRQRRGEERRSRPVTAPARTRPAPWCAVLPWMHALERRGEHELLTRCHSGRPRCRKSWRRRAALRALLAGGTWPAAALRTVLLLRAVGGRPAARAPRIAPFDPHCVCTAQTRCCCCCWGRGQRPRTPALQRSPSEAGAAREKRRVMSVSAGWTRRAVVKTRGPVAPPQAVTPWPAGRAQRRAPRGAAAGPALPAARRARARRTRCPWRVKPPPPSPPAAAGGVVRL